MLVAVAEDDPDITFLLEAMLSDHGYEVVMTDNGEGALAVCRERQPDVLLLDRTMPGDLDGMEVLRRIRADPGLAQLPVVLVSAHSGGDQVAAALEAGANAYLVKPFPLKDLLSLLASLAPIH